MHDKKTFISIICQITLTIVAVINLFKDSNNSTQSNKPTFTLPALFWWILIVLIIFLNTLFFYIKHQKKQKTKLRITLDTNNNIVTQVITYLNERCIYINSKKYDDDHVLYDDLNNICHQVGEYIQKLLCIVTDQSDISVCIKGARFDKRWTNNFSDINLKVLSRSTNTDPTRLSEDNCHVSSQGNTAIREIFDEHKPYYYCNDLIEASKRKLYSNTTHDWDSKYKTAIITPIKTDAYYIRQVLPEYVVKEPRNTYAYYGFLAADSSVIGAFETMEMQSIKILQLFSELLVPIFECIVNKKAQISI